MRPEPDRPGSRRDGPPSAGPPPGGPPDHDLGLRRAVAPLPPDAFGSAGPGEAGPEGGDVPRPIGPERLKALREAIRQGAYPTRADVEDGLVHLFGRRPRRGPPA